MTFTLCAAAFCIIATALNLGGLTIAAFRLRPRGATRPTPADAPAVTIIRPLCRINNYERETLASTFMLDYPSYDIIFCLEDGNDPVAGLVYNLMEKFPGVRAQLLIGQERRTKNPKLNNCLKGWDAAENPWIIMADSNVLMPRDYIQQMMGRWTEKTGLVCSMPIGTQPDNAWAEIECAFLNTFQARWQYVGESLGQGFAQGKSMLMRRDIVDAGGGLLKTLGAEIAEDAAFTKLVRQAGLHVHLVNAPFAQPLGERTGQEVWSRQARWAMLRRKTFPLMYLPELLTGGFFPIVAGLYAAWDANVNVAVVGAILAALWYGPEALLARIAGWHFSSRMLLACALRDFLLPPLWVVAWLQQDYVWRGNAVNVKQVVAEELE
ncbi:ceramide glucosyltransferase [Acidisoma silvae]|uniref:Glycosyltransferase n=1 Tax=Acidisoma silvae TaxID=2802396 RepID=A0A963YS82_9PROT|nr:ceramide glucosyltransferase [Acidisoma silvae]MCB8876067.1 glycosyltransferase [Acidisoma silvae]